MKHAIVLALGVMVAASTPAWAVQPDEMLSDPKLEQRARDLSTGLRCMVCQNQSIDDSDAPLAKDLRVLVRERIKLGDDDAQVKSYLVDRYGDFILLKPPVKSGTVILWATPLVALLAGGLLAAVVLRARAKARPTVLTEDERTALARLVKDPPAD